ncbi:hypothetical protein SK128_001376 [Halocaridina rubra]|uniref:Uncharacterized protein n=1 Tax=Halocaridina rubra TaxID=373956 RepID=A0AAN8XEM4_HALRR
MSWGVTVVVASNNYDFLDIFTDVCDEGRLLVWSTRLLIMGAFSKDDLQKLTETKWVLTMMNSMVVHLPDNPSHQSVDVYAHHPYHLSGQKRLIKVASWTPRGLKLSSQMKLFPEKHVK